MVKCEQNKARRGWPKFVFNFLHVYFLYTNLSIKYLVFSCFYRLLICFFFWEIDYWYVGICNTKGFSMFIFAVKDRKMYGLKFLMIVSTKYFLRKIQSLWLSKIKIRSLDGLITLMHPVSSWQQVRKKKKLYTEL